MADIATARTEDSMHSVYDGDIKMLESVHCCALILGTIFSSSPHEPQCRQAIDGLDAMDPTEEWPLGNKEDLVEASDLIQKGALDYDGLCGTDANSLGPEHFEAPQWASVYLDPDSIVFGCAHLELQWMRTHRIYPNILPAPAKPTTRWQGNATFGMDCGSEARFDLRSCRQPYNAMGSTIFRVASHILRQPFLGRCRTAGIDVSL